MRKVNSSQQHNKILLSLWTNAGPSFVYALESISHSQTGTCDKFPSDPKSVLVAFHLYIISVFTSPLLLESYKKTNSSDLSFFSRTSKGFGICVAPKSNWFSHLIPSLVQSVHKHVKFFFSYLTEITDMNWKGYRTSDIVKQTLSFCCDVVPKDFTLKLTGLHSQLNIRSTK